jgi:hypothetical protein
MFVYLLTINDAPSRYSGIDKWDAFLDGCTKFVPYSLNSPANVISPES